jgi:hypothetical protein
MRETRDKIKKDKSQKKTWDKNEWEDSYSFLILDDVLLPTEKDLRSI